MASASGTVYSSTACAIDPCVGDSVYTNDGYGNVLIIGYEYDVLPPRIQELIPEGANLYILYAHLKEPSALTEGDKVTPGQIIGNVGTTGNSDGVHLHMELRVEPKGITMPTGKIHQDGNWTTVHYTWHSLNILNPNDFFEIN